MNKLAFCVTTLLSLCATSASAVSIINDGLTHEITTASGALEISDSPLGDPTIVKLLPGGTVADVDVLGNSQFLMSGGILNGTLAMKSNSLAEISGGSVDEDPFYLTDFSQLTITGGDVSEGLRIYGNSKVFIHGANFLVDGIPVPFGPLAATTGRLTGDLLDGQINSNLGTNDNASITLIPEPTTLTLFTLAAIPLLKKRKVQRHQ